MPENLQEIEFNTFGIGKTLRRGLIVGMITILCCCVAYLFVLVQGNKDRIIDMQGAMYERLLKQQEQTLADPVRRMNAAADRTNRVVIKVDSVATQTDSLNNMVIQKYRK